MSVDVNYETSLVVAALLPLASSCIRLAQPMALQVR